jgi:soluble cytochrome b562
MQEYDTLKQTVIALQTQTEAANQAVKHENEHAKLLRQHADALQKESQSVVHRSHAPTVYVCSCRQLAVEQFRRRAAELAHTSADLKLQLEKTNTQLCEAQKSTADKTHAQETNAVQMRRVQEELDLMRRRLERAKKFERADRIDEVYQEEIRELKVRV